MTIAAQAAKNLPDVQSPEQQPEFQGERGQQLRGYGSQKIDSRTASRRKVNGLDSSRGVTSKGPPIQRRLLVFV
jgi:hypothetical protein